VRAADALPEAARLPAEILRYAGFRTVGLHRNTWVDTNFGFAQGFDVYHQPAPLADPPGFERRKPGGAPLAGSDESLTRAAIEFLERQGDARFLLYLHYMDVHEYSYDGAADRFGDGYPDAYDNAILWFDRNLAALVAALEKGDLARRTLLVIASDHGEELREHGEIGHARTLYREVVEVPLLIVPPSPLELGLVVRAPVANVDLWPTLLDWLKLPALEGAQGRSLLGEIESAARDAGAAAAPADEKPTFAWLDLTWSSSRLAPLPHLLVAKGRWRLHQWFPAGGPSTGQLYDLERDPGEQHDLATARPDVVEELVALGRAQRDAPPPPWGAPTRVEIDRMRLGQLQALGYVVE
jgi:arylsulfatase A-like enzyme